MRPRAERHPLPAPIPFWLENDGARAVGATVVAQLPGRRSIAGLLRAAAGQSTLTRLAPHPRAREGRADPAPSVSGTTRDPTDPLAPPAGRRRRFYFAKFFFVEIRLGANAGARVLGAIDDDDDAAGRAARLSYRVVENTRH